MTMKQELIAIARHTDRIHQIAEEIAALPPIEDEEDGERWDGQE